MNLLFHPCIYDTFKAFYTSGGKKLKILRHSVQKLALHSFWPATNCQGVQTSEIEPISKDQMTFIKTFPNKMY